MFTGEELQLHLLESKRVWRKESYIPPKGDIHNAWNRPWPEGQMFRDDSDHEVNYMLQNRIAVPVDGRCYPNAKPLNSHWVCNLKWRPGNTEIGEEEWVPLRGRTRWVPWGCDQTEGVDYDLHGVSSPVARAESFSVLFILAAQFGLFRRLVDIEKAFFMGELDHEVFTYLPPGYRTPSYMMHGPHTIWLLLKAVNGLKQGGYAYYIRWKTDLEANGYRALKSDPCVFLRMVPADASVPLSEFAAGPGKGYDIFLISLWVDDNTCAYSSDSMLQHFWATLKGCGYGWRDLGDWKHALGLDFNVSAPCRTIIGVGHGSYLSTFFAKIPLDEWLLRETMQPKATTPARKGQTLSIKDKHDPSVAAAPYWTEAYSMGVGAMSHIKNWTHPEIAVTVSMLSQFLSCPGNDHWKLLLRLLSYVFTVKDKMRWFKRSGGDDGRPVFFGYCDADYAGCTDTRRSRSGYCFFLFGMLMGYRTKLQHSVTLSTAEAEFVALVMAVQFAMWAVQLLNELGIVLPSCVEIYSDNKSCLAIAHNPVDHKYTKHIDIRMMFLRELVKGPRKKAFDFLFVRGPLNLANGFTKHLGTKMHREFADDLFNETKVYPPTTDRVMARLSTMRLHLDDPSIPCPCDNIKCMIGKQM